MTIAFRPTGTVYYLPYSEDLYVSGFNIDDRPNVVMVSNTGTEPVVVIIADPDNPQSPFYNFYFADWPTGGTGHGMVVMPGQSQLMAVNTANIIVNLAASAVAAPGSTPGSLLFTSGSLE